MKRDRHVSVEVTIYNTQMVMADLEENGIQVSILVVGSEHGIKINGIHGPKKMSYFLLFA